NTGADGWNPTRALNVILRACEAVAFAHSKKVVHRDLKPGNIMVGRFGEVYVMDWGLARVLGREETKDIRLRTPGPRSATFDSARRHTVPDTPEDALLTMDGDVVGTPAYMPPEQAAGHLEELGPRSDVYAAGAILYHLLAGHIPYVPPGAQVSNRTVLGLVLNGPPPQLAHEAPAAPPALLAICEKAMARNPAARYESMLDLGADLRAFLEDHVVRAYRTGPLAELRAWVRRNRGITWTLSAAALLVVVLLWSYRSVIAERELAVARKSEFEQLAGGVLLEKAVEKEKRLYPTSPHMIAPMEQWLAEDADQVLMLRPKIEATLAKLRARALRRAQENSDRRDEDLAAAKPGLPSRGTLQFEEPSQQALFDTLTGLLQRMVAFEAKERADVEDCLAWARRVEALTLHHPRARISWEDARKSITAADRVWRRSCTAISRSTSNRRWASCRSG
ncbi:MAG: serine/threonine-protein kinase, partial [Planctomycetota bacterium]